MPTGLCFSGAGEVVLGGSGRGAPALATPLFISPSIWFLGISFNKPVLTHEPGAAAGLGRGPLPRESGAGTFWACAWAISALLCREEVGTSETAEASSLPWCKGLGCLSSPALQVP